MMLPAGGTVALGFPAGDLAAFPPVLEVESSEQETLWREGVTLASAAYHAARICWCCGSPWNDAGECPTKGCRGPGSGYIQPVILRSRPCCDCGQPTTDWYVAGAVSSAGDGEHVSIEGVARCAACERQRNLAQAIAVLERSDVYEHVKDRMRAYLAECGQVEVAPCP